MQKSKTKLKYPESHSQKPYKNIKIKIKINKQKIKKRGANNDAFL